MQGHEDDACPDDEQQNGLLPFPQAEGVAPAAHLEPVVERPHHAAADGADHEHDTLA